MTVKSRIQNLGSINDVFDSPIPIVASATTSLKPSKQGDIFSSLWERKLLSSFKPTEIGSWNLTFSPQLLRYDLNVTLTKSVFKNACRHILSVGTCACQHLFSCANIWIPPPAQWGGGLSSANGDRRNPKAFWVRSNRWRRDQDVFPLEPVDGQAAKVDPKYDN